MATSFVTHEILAPLVRRIGTAVSGALMTWGITTDAAHDVMIGLVALAGIGADLWQDRRARRREREAALRGSEK